MSILISIVIPCYNQAKYLEEAVNSVLAQTYTNWECIIVNDGSPDNTEEVALTLAKKDNRIKYFKKHNGGLADARNYGIERANGTWVLPLDADDKICQFYLEYAFNQIKRDNNISIIYCRASFFGEKEGEWILPNYSFSRILVENHIFCSAIFRKTDWLKAQGYDTNMKFGFEDWEFWINLLKFDNRKVIKLNYIGFMYRKQKESMTLDLIKSKESIRMMHDYIYNKHKDVYYNNLGSFQDLAAQYIKVNDNNKYFNQSINHNYITKILFKLIRLLNRF